MSKVLETYKAQPDKAGYFRIGDVELVIPPEEILTSRVENSDELTTLRAKYPMVVKTGQARLDVTITWKALLVTGSKGVDYSQWEDLQRVLAIFKAAPFVEVENEHIRSLLVQQDGRFDTARMAFGLRQLRVDTIPDVVDGLQATLTMTLFNFIPYTRDFAYRDEDNSETDANLSARFSAYINAWMDENLNALGEDGTSSSWKDIDNGGVLFHWKSYMALPWKPTETNTPPDSPSGYTFDYSTDRSSFYYRDNFIGFEGSQEFQGNDSGVYANGISVTFVNNLAQIPLSNYQYPTYQHVGPGTTMVSMAFLTDTPEADGLGQITSMIDELNSQFLRLRSEFRKVASIHATQAIFVDNAVLNMLGVYSILPKGFNTSTVRESTNIEAALMGIQYENMFEDIDPFRTKNTSLAYDATLTKLATDPAFLKSLSPEEAALIKPLMDFYNAKSSRNLAYLQDKISKIDDNTRKAIGSMPVIPMPDGISPAATSQIYQILDQKVPESSLPALAGVAAGSFDLNSITTAQSSAQGVVDSFNTKMFSSLYPTLNEKRSTPPSFTDYFILDSVATTYNLTLPSGVNNIRTDIYNKIKASDPSPIDTLYDWAFKSLALSDRQFTQALQQLQKSPKFTSAFEGAVQSQGPANDPFNENHGAYRDLGLRSLNLGAADFNPGFYFVDHGTELYNKTWDTLNGKNVKPGDFTIKDIYGGGAAINTPQTRGGVVTTPLVPGNVDYDNSFALMTRASIPGYSMASAFPTFKLFLMEDSNDTVFYSYDDFYSYSSVSEIEIIRYKDKPDTALLQITNLAGLLTHKLFDNSVQGRRELFLQNAPIQPFNSDGSTVATPGGETAIGAGRDPITGEAFNYTTGKGAVSDEFDFADNPNKEVPLKYYALQTGSKIQIRMGFSNNPDKLWPVFTGQVTQLEEENGIITLMAQSYMLELLDQADEDLKTDGWGFSSIGESLDLNILSPITNMMSGHPIDAVEEVLQFRWVPRGKAYSGYALWGTTGETDEVIKDMLKVSTARHFGRWQINQGGDPFVKGFRWEQKLGNALAALGLDRIANAISTGNDRSGENILINHLINADGSGKTGKITELSRPANFEKPKVIVPAKYSIPSKDKQPPWVYIKDISRRYPEYNLLVKSYGYPYGADATLVFAHPHDWYYSRLPFLGDQEMSLPDDRRDKPAFSEWWDRIGKTKFTVVAKAYLSNPDDVIREIDSEKSYATFYYMLIFIRNAVTDKGTATIPSFIPFIGKAKVDVGATGDISRALGILPIFQAGFNAQQARNAVETLRKASQAYIATVNSGVFLTANANSRVQPVCKYHFIDDKMIINNGMRVNSKIYNTVKVGEENIPINEFIPPHHRRLLDCNPAIVNPDENVNGAGYETIRVCYAQSFLRDEIGKMYYGDIILRGAPEIEPLDVLLITDPSTGIVGPVEVDSVIHSFNQEMGYITIIKPRALVLTNEAATATFLAKLIDSYNTAGAQIEGFSEEWKKATGVNKGIVGLEEGSKAAGIAAVGMFGGPGIVIGMALAARVITGAVNFSHKLAPCIVIPVMRYNRPWLGGLEGYRMQDFASIVFDKAEQFSTDEIWPVINSWRTLKQLVNPSLANTTKRPTPTPNTLKKLTPGSAANVSSLNPKFQEALNRWLAEVKAAGFKPTITSGFRTQAQQDKLIAEARAGKAKYLVAMKHSKHSDGIAADVVFDSITAKNFAISIANKYNIAHPFPTTDPVHFEWKG